MPTASPDPDEFEGWLEIFPTQITEPVPSPDGIAEEITLSFPISSFAPQHRLFLRLAATLEE